MLSHNISARSTVWRSFTSCWVGAGAFTPAARSPFETAGRRYRFRGGHRGRCRARALLGFGWSATRRRWPFCSRAAFGGTRR